MKVKLSVLHVRHCYNMAVLVRRILPHLAWKNHLRFKHPDEYTVVKADGKTSQESTKASNATARRVLKLWDVRIQIN